MTDKTPRAWDGALEQEFYTPEEIAASDARVGKAQRGIDRAWIIEGLEFTLQESGWDANVAYDQELMIQVVTEAIALLKAQEPRVMTWDEVFCENRPFVVWIETRHGDTTEPLAFVDGEYVNTDCTLFVELNLENQRDYMADKDDGFRFWTAQPTLAEMEAASWA